jgi:anti-sigma regulatory factor (Ser/Thr protein kinase)
MSTRQRLRFAGTRPAFVDASLRLRGLLGAERLQDTVRDQVELAFEEIASNIVRHGSPTADVEVTIAIDPDEVVLTFEDDGVPFDPCVRPGRSLPASLDEARPGGLGLLMVQQLSSRMTYTRTPDGRNSLTLAISRM